MLNIFFSHIIVGVTATRIKRHMRRQIFTSDRSTCAPSMNNPYFGTRGALRCLHEAGDVAVVELQRLKDIAEELKLNPEEYKIMCKDGKIVPTNGFEVDRDCPIVTIVDGEIIIKRRSPKGRDVVQALSSFDRYFSVNGNPDFKMYNKFNGIENLLFEVSS